jgi:hypothetical protein
MKSNSKSIIKFGENAIDLILLMMTVIYICSNYHQIIGYGCEIINEIINSFRKVTLPTSWIFYQNLLENCMKLLSNY